MMKQAQYVPKTHSTNDLMRELIRKQHLPEGFLLSTDFQTAGKGQPGNAWEAEKGKNLLFSILLYPHRIPIDRIFILSEITCLAIKEVLDEYTDNISIKWPNDIYWKNKKIGGILIENSLSGMKISSSIIGIGLNINQISFKSNAPNPVSLKKITGKTVRRKTILQKIYSRIQAYYQALDVTEIHKNYLKHLYRKDGFHLYRDAASGLMFKAKILHVDYDGKLSLQNESNEVKEYYFKEVQFIL